MCLYPKLIGNKKYTKNKKNGGVIPTVKDTRTLLVPVGCQNCIECRKQKARGWQLRLLEDLKEHKNGKFVTLTFNDKSIKELSQEIWGIDGYDLDNEIATMGVHRFLNRHRKEHGKSIRHWLVTELGHQGTENIHMHGILWTNEPLEKIEQIWQYGYMWKGKRKANGYDLTNYVNEQTVNYIIKYVTKVDYEHRTYKSKILTSPGIGSNYTKGMDSKSNKYKEVGTTNETYRTRQGYKIAMPIYWRNKIYSETEREKLWLQKLDKQERWVCGERVSVKENDKDYYKVLMWHRKRNYELGYGNTYKNWNMAEYERQKRNLKIQERINRANQ